MKNKSIYVLLSNLIFLLLYAVALPWPWGLGLMMITAVGKFDSVIDIFYIWVIVLLLFAPVLGIIGIILSVVYRKKERYAAAVGIQLLPFAALLIAAFVFIFVCLFGGLFTGT